MQEYKEPILKKDEILEITNELKSHIYKEDFFVDPDKKFISLLERITNFFEKDDFIIAIKDNEELYENFKEKYENAIIFIKSLEKEQENQTKKFSYLKEKEIQENIKIVRENYLSNKRDSFYDALESPLAKLCLPNKSTDSAESKTNEFSLAENENQFFLNSNEKNFIKDSKAKKIQVIERLKDEYHNLVEDKKNLENKLFEASENNEKFLEMQEKNENLLMQLEMSNEKIKILIEEKNNFLERNNKITFENYEFSNSNNQLRESLKYLEKERTQTKNKINANFNKSKLLEKENNTSKKKISSLNSNIKNLTEIVNNSLEEKNQLQKKIEDLKEEYENKITNLNLEKQKLIKDSFLTTMASLEEKKIPLEFIYEEDKNSLIIMLEDIVVTEFNNLRIFKMDKKFSETEDENLNDCKNEKKLNLNFSESKQNNNFIESPNKSNFNMNINNKNIFNNPMVSGSTHKNLDLENLLSLNKVLSNSSKKSFTNTNTKRILLSNLSSSKKISDFNDGNFNGNNNNQYLPSDFNFKNSQNFSNENIQNFLKNTSTNNYYNNNPLIINNIKIESEKIFDENPEKLYMNSPNKKNLVKNNTENHQEKSYTSKALNLTMNKNYEKSYINERYSGMKNSNKKNLKEQINRNIPNKFTSASKNTENIDPNLPAMEFKEDNFDIKSSNYETKPPSAIHEYQTNITNINITNINNNIDEKFEIKSYNTEKKEKYKNCLFGKQLNDTNNNKKFEKCLRNINLNTEQINNFNKDDIKNYINTAATTRHRKMISLDEAMNLDDIPQNEKTQENQYNTNTEKETIFDNLNVYFSHDNFGGCINKSNNNPLKENKDKISVTKLSKKFNFDLNTIEEFENINNNYYSKTLIVETVIDDLVISSQYEKEPKKNPMEELMEKSSRFLIDSNVNLVTINSYRNFENKVVRESQAFFKGELKDKIYHSENLKFSYNAEIKIEKLKKEKELDEVNQKIKFSNFIGEEEEKKWKIMSIENINLINEKKIMSEETKIEINTKPQNEINPSFSLNLDEFKFSQEENFMKKYNDNKVEIDFTKNKVQISEINLSDKKDLKKIKEELIENNYDDNVRLETITGSKKIKGDRLNYNPLTEENISNQNIKTDSIMNIKDKLNNSHQTSNNSKKRRNAQSDKNNDNYKATNKFIVKKVIDDDEDRGKCSRCLIL